MNNFFGKKLLLVNILIVLFSCGGGGGSNNSPTVEDKISPPIAEEGDSQNTPDSSKPPILIDGGATEITGSIGIDNKISTGGSNHLNPNSTNNMTGDNRGTIVVNNPNNGTSINNGVIIDVNNPNSGTPTQNSKVNFPGSSTFDNADFNLAAQKAQEMAICEATAYSHMENNRCVCNEANGYYNFPERNQASPTPLNCSSAMRSLYIDFIVGDQTSSGTDANISLEVCPQNTIKNTPSQLDEENCLFYTISTDGNTFEKGTWNRVIVDWGEDAIIPLLGGIKSIKITTGGGGSNPRWLLEGFRLSATPRMDNAPLLERSIMYNPQVVPNNVPGLGMNLYHNPCIFDWLEVNVPYTIYPDDPPVLRLTRACQR